MKDYTKPEMRGRTGVHAQATEVDAGLRAHMIKVYNYMAAGLALTGVIAFFVVQSPALLQALFAGPQAFVVLLAPTVFSFAMAFGLHKMKTSTAQMLFWAFCVVMGMSIMAMTFIVYQPTSIARVFFITAILFGSMSLCGYTTKRDLTGVGSFLMMGFWGIFIAAIVNLFLQSEAVMYAISGIGVIVFTGLAAYSNQQIKQMYYMVPQSEHGKAAVLGAYTLYVTFINLMIMLLHLFGERR